MYQMSQGYTPSRLERIAYNASPVQYSARAPVYTPTPMFVSSAHSTAYEAGNGEPMGQAYSQVLSSSYVLDTVQQEYHFQPDTFLKPGKEGKFVGKAEDVREFVEEAFEKMGIPMPTNIKLSVLDEQKFRKLAPHPSTIGLSINRGKQGLLSEVFVLQGSIGRVLLTIGHEIGHVLTETLPSGENEEAKAYAFSLKWMETIQQHNIAGLQNALVTEVPAPNGLHDVAFAYVMRLIRQGKTAWQVYRDLVGINRSI